MAPRSKRTKSGNASRITNVGTTRNNGPRRSNPSANANKAKDVNLYAKTLLDPAGTPGVHIPDDSCLPSLTFQTVGRAGVVSNTGGYVYLAIIPTLTNNLLNVRCNPDTGALKMQSDNADTLEPTWEGGGISNILSDSTINAVVNTYAAMRPVSMQVKYIPTQAALTAQGVAGTACWPREQMAAAWDSQVTNSVGGITFGSLAHWPSGMAPASFDGLKDTALTETNAMTGFTTMWKPEDSACLTYRDLGTIARGPDSPSIQNFGTSDTFGGFHFWNYNVDNGGDNVAIQYISPWPVGITADWTGIGTPGYSNPNAPADTEVCYLPTPQNEEMSYPMVVCAFSGTVPSTTLGELEVIINWEVIPQPGAASIMVGEPSPNNPDELAQALNIVEHVPPTVIDSPGDPNARIRKAAISSTSDLYDPNVSHKKAIEGTSFFDRVKKFASKIDWGLVASAGKALLSVL